MSGVRAKQQQQDDEERREVLGILLHGDAALAGQGVVAETFAFSALRGYACGTDHIIVNNQVGFNKSALFALIALSDRCGENGDGADFACQW